MIMLDLLKKRRSTRSFQEQTVEQDKVDALTKSALLAPSSRGRRPWEFVVVDDRDVLAQLATCREHGSGFLAEAPLAIVVVADPAKCDVWVEDASIAATLVQVTAESLGLGSCWIQVRNRERHNVSSSEIVKEILEIPASYEVECILAVGYKNEVKDPYTDEDLHFEKLHHNRYNA